MSELIFSTPLQKMTNGEPRTVCSGETVEEVLRAADQKYPGLFDSIVSGGKIVPFVHVAVDGAALGESGLSAAVGPDSTIRLIAAVAGG